AMFAYFVLIPMGVKFLLSLSTPDLLPIITADRYLSFIFMLMLGCGIIFEMPVLFYFLTKLGLVNAEMLIKNWKYIILLIFIISAIITPTPDVFNQIIFAIPMFLLYIISIWVSYLARQKE
ncbi:MAG TPA: twin-arginine translocase subunit TatC, partial [Elusimicrobia bacterium]|nr:twin-arginine translocase subunit TatC [Elusimicrobiota bacterium]